MKENICIIGLGYVGLPLAHAFAKAGYTVLGYDISERRIEELKNGHDRTNELSAEELKQTSITFTTDPSLMKESDVLILALPTPVDANNKPDLALVEAASHTVGKYLKRGAIVVYESTVYPGVTEEICGPILAQESGLVCGTDFTLGYSPERINPGDKEHTVERIVKIVAGQDAETLAKLTELYGSVIKAGIHQASSIRVAEMAKAIENAQRDLNIAFMNEVALLCHKIGIPTNDVLAAAGTKWNFLKFKPGLVGGHCIGVDPYYLVEKARMLGMETQVITAGRAINDGMSKFIAGETLDALKTPNPQILVLGLTFKEDVPDTRNSKVFDVIEEFRKAGATVKVEDPFVTDEEMNRKNITRATADDGPFDAVLLLVAHKEFLALPLEKLIERVKPDGIFYDLKNALDGKKINEAGRRYFSL